MTAIKRVTKAVFPVAGLGTRFLPATKANPKEMLPVVDKPLIQYAVEEAVAAGITELVFITGRSKRAIPDHFDTAYELEATLEKGGKQDMLELVRNITPPNVTCIYIRQAAPLGLGHAVLCAAPVVGDAPFAVLLADDLIAARDPGLHTATCLKDMIEVYNQRGASIIGVEQIPIEFSRRYGVVRPREVGAGLYEVDDIVEKPAPENAPSNLGVVGRYVLTPRVFDLLRATQRGAGGEIQLTDALAELIKFERLFAYSTPGHRYDCGSKLGYLEATIEYGLRHPELGKEFKQFLLERANESFEPRP
jgi:UTP--glucose-1-phosphate uridylyltransferase